MNQTTCARRISALEQQLGVRLFERLPAGYALADGARQLLGAAETMERGAREFEQGVAVLRRDSDRVIRLTSVDALIDALVLPAVARFQEKCPDVRVEIDISQRLLDLAQGEADVAIRASKHPPEDLNLVARKLGTLRIAAYGGRDYAARKPLPASLHELPAHAIVALEGPFADWLQARGFGAHIVQVVGTIPAVIAAVRMGNGVALLPRIVADKEEDLLHCFDLPEEDAGLWLIYPERLRGRRDLKVLSSLVSDEVDMMRARKAISPSSTGRGA